VGAVLGKSFIQSFENVKAIFSGMWVNGGRFLSQMKI
jgi:hypothetical protein